MNTLFSSRLVRLPKRTLCITVVMVLLAVGAVFGALSFTSPSTVWEGFVSPSIKYEGFVSPSIKWVGFVSPSTKWQG